MGALGGMMLPGLEAEEVTRLRGILSLRYEGVFTPEAIEAHLRDSVGFPFAQQVAGLVETHLPTDGNVADLGCGFGSFVLVMLARGREALGVELDDLEVEWARLRAERLIPGREPERLFVLGDAARPPLPEGDFDAVTCWNLLEHVPDTAALIAQARRLLRPGGNLFLICPNYFAFRQEAHYHVPWRPLLSRRAAAARLRAAGKNPAFFESSIFQRSNWSVLLELTRQGFELYDLLGGPRLDLRPGNLTGLWANRGAALALYNPLKENILLRAVKRSAS